MIEDGHGDLLAADVEALVNPVNTVGVMGKGLALEFKRRFPGNFDGYRAACARGEVQVGQVWVFEGRPWVLNFPTKRHWRSRSRVGDVAAGLDSLVDRVRELGIGSVAVPALGCGEGGLAWDDVRPLIERAAEAMGEVRVVVFAPLTKGGEAPRVAGPGTSRAAGRGALRWRARERRGRLAGERRGWRARELRGDEVTWMVS